MRMQGTVETPWFDSVVLKGNLPGTRPSGWIPIYLPPGYAVIRQAISGDLRPCRARRIRHDLSQLAGLGRELPRADRPADHQWRHGAGDRGLPGLLHHLRRGAVPQQLGARPLRGLSRSRRSSRSSTDTTGPCPTRAHRAISGKSSGGYGAMVQAMRHPEVFGALANHSGDIYFEFGLLPDLAKLHANLLKLGGVEAFIARSPTYKPKSHDPFYSVLGMLCYGAAYAPNPDAPRGFDMPIDMETGALREDVWARWLAWDPVRMIDRPDYLEAWRSMRYIYMDCGLWDELNFPVGTRDPVEQAEGRGDRPRLRAVPRRAHRRAVPQRCEPAAAGAGDRVEAWFSAAAALAHALLNGPWDPSFTGPEGRNAARGKGQVASPATITSFSGLCQSPASACRRCRQLHRPLIIRTDQCRRNLK